MLQDFRGDSVGEVFRELNSSILFAWARRVSVSSNVAVSLLVRIFICFAPPLPSGEIKHKGFGELQIPNEKTVQVEIGPLLGLPPVMFFSVGNIAHHNRGRKSL